MPKLLLRVSFFAQTTPTRSDSLNWSNIILLLLDFSTKKKFRWSPSGHSSPGATRYYALLTVTAELLIWTVSREELLVGGSETYWDVFWENIAAGFWSSFGRIRSRSLKSFSRLESKFNFASRENRVGRFQIKFLDWLIIFFFVEIVGFQVNCKKRNHLNQSEALDVISTRLFWILQNREVGKREAFQKMRKTID